MSNIGDADKWSEKELVTFFYWFKDKGKNWKSIQESLNAVGFERSVQDIKDIYRRNMGYLGLPTAKAKDFVTIVNDYYKAIESDSENSDAEEENEFQTPKNSNHNKDPDYGIEWNEEIVDDTPAKRENTLLSSIARDNTRGPYGVDIHYNDHHNHHKSQNLKPNIFDSQLRDENGGGYQSVAAHKIIENSKRENFEVSNFVKDSYKLEALNKSPNYESGRKKQYKMGSAKSTPQPSRYIYESCAKPVQSTAMKRRWKRDPTICRRGIESMNPYEIVKNEIETLKLPNQTTIVKENQYSKTVERWVRWEYFYSTIDKWYFSHNQFKQVRIIHFGTDSFCIWYISFSHC